MRLIRDLDKTGAGRPVGGATWAAVVVAVAVVAGVIAMVASFLAGIGGAGMSTGGWVAMILGILATLALGIGLMTLVFLSSRRGYDEPDRDRR